ncbi:IS607 family transposase [Limnospira platensis]|uniref:IS607 family transposase n=1 Tax=Limnospira platensis TaxID=118562 RepID=UPI0004A0DAE4|nr:DNA invertase [Arthrospira platensis str. Paraca]
MPKYTSPSETSQYFGVCLHTLRRWEKDGQIQAIRTPKGQRRYEIASYKGISDRIRQRAIIAYARVSSRGQKADLDGGAAKLLEVYPNAELITDIASGLNFKRAGLRAVLELLRQGDVGFIVVAHFDRLARFGFDLISWLCELDKTKIVVLNQDGLSPERELVEDILAIVHIYRFREASYSCRLYGLRKYKSAIKKDPDLSQS